MDKEFKKVKNQGRRGDERVVLDCIRNRIFLSKKLFTTFGSPERVDVFYKKDKLGTTLAIQKNTNGEFKICGAKYSIAYITCKMICSLKKPGCRYEYNKETISIKDDTIYIKI